MFHGGLHTYPSRLEGGLRLARDVRNLRADADGYLRLRYPTELHPFTQDVDSIALSPRHLWTLGDFFYARHLDERINDEPREVDGADDLDGRLSIMSEFRDYVLVASDGVDRGYWVDIRDDDVEELQAYPLGLEAPTFNVTVSDGTASAGSIVLDEAGGPYYVLAFTYVRAFWDAVDLDDVALPSQVANKEFTGDELFNGVESNPGAYVAFSIESGVPNARFYHEDEEIPIFVIDATEGAAISGMEFPDDEQVTGIYVYVAAGLAPDDYHVGALDFQVVDYLEEGETAGTLHRPNLSGELRPSFRVDNDVLPEKAFQLVHFNGLVFATLGDELRYCDLRDGVVEAWAWPLANSIKVNGRVDFAIEHRGILIFGSQDGLWRLSGADEFTFDVDKFSSVGPVSSAAIGFLEQGLGFINATGFYVTDGVQVQKLSSPMLDGFFEVEDIIDGAVVLLPTNDILWSCVLADRSHVQFLQSVQGGWFSWTGADVLQAVSARGIVLFSDGERLKSLEYLEENTAEDVEWLWESQELDFGEDGFGESLKTWKWLEVSASHEGEGTFTYWLDDGDAVAETFTFRTGPRPFRIPINRIGIRFRFRVSGTGPCVIREFRLIADTRAGGSRF